MNKRNHIFFVSMLLTISCLISGVMLCGSLVTYAIESKIPVTTVVVASPETVIEEDDEQYVLVRERAKSNPKFDIVDGDQIWSEDCEINIFKISYDNETGEITVDGNGNKVIAPGTQNTYYFELQNNGDVGVEYEVTMNAYISDNITSIPVDVKLSDYTGRYIVGSETTWENVLVINPERVTETGELPVGNSMRYILSWQWPYESGDDEFDTYLGNLAVDEDVTLTIEISTVATADEYAEGGFATGDESNVSIYLIAAAASLSLLVFLIILRRKEEDDNDEA